MALIEDGRVVEFRIEQPSTRESVGDIFVGRITDVLPGIQAAFVDIGTGKSGYLHRDQLLSYKRNHQNQKQSKSISSFAHQGQEVLVQVVKEGVGDKGPKLTEVIEIPGAMLVYLPLDRSISVSRKLKDEAEREKWKQFGEQECQQEDGVIFRTACEGKTQEIVLAELNKQRDIYKTILKQQKLTNKPALLYQAETFVQKLLQEISVDSIDEIIVDDFEMYQYLRKTIGGKVERYSGKENVFQSHQLEIELEKALNKVVTLANGAYIVIEKTEACTIIDVNSGKFQGKASQKETAFITNIEAAKEIARQLRLRDIGGMILIDFIDMKNPSEREKVISAFKTIAKLDQNQTTVYGFTRLGIVEVTRKRTRHSLQEILLSDCSPCESTGRVLSASSYFYRLERELIEFLRSDAEAVWVEVSSELKKFIDEENKHVLLEEISQLSVHVTEGINLEQGYLIRHIGSKAEVKSRLL